MDETYSVEQIKEYLANVEAEVHKGRIDPETFGTTFAFYQAKILEFDLDLKNEKLRVDVVCIDWLKENTGTVNPYIPHKLVFHDTVQFMYRNRAERQEFVLYDLKALTISDRLMESKDLYAFREESGLKPIVLDIQMPLEDSELLFLCSEFEVHVGDQVIMVGT